MKLLAAVRNIQPELSGDSACLMWNTRWSRSEARWLATWSDARCSSDASFAAPCPSMLLCAEPRTQALVFAGLQVVLRS